MPAISDSTSTTPSTSKGTVSRTLRASMSSGSANSLSFATGRASALTGAPHDQAPGVVVVRRFVEIAEAFDVGETRRFEQCPQLGRAVQKGQDRRAAHDVAA